jgi:hypothetical protein
MKSYCTQNDGDCETCGLVNYGRDCRNVPLMANVEQAEALVKEAAQGIVQIGETRFNALMAKAQCMKNYDQHHAEYWTGVMRGLRRAYHGEAFGTAEEHALWLAAADSDDVLRRQRGQGYRAGLRGLADGPENDQAKG